MIQKFLNLERRINELKEKAKNGTKWEMTISKELYDSLILEFNHLNSLCGLVEHSRSGALLRVLMWDLVSEQLEEFNIEEMGLSRAKIEAIREWNKAPRLDHEQEIKDYGWSISQYEIKKAKRSINTLLRNWPDNMYHCMDAFEERPKGKIAVYEIIQDCYPNELFKDIWCDNDNQLMQILGNSTMNIPQLHRLYKNEKLVFGDYHAMFSIVNKKVVLLWSFCHRHETCKWYPPSRRLKKWTKLLLFMPLELGWVTEMQKNYWTIKKNGSTQPRKTGIY